MLEGAQGPLEAFVAAHPYWIGDWASYAGPGAIANAIRAATGRPVVRFPVRAEDFAPNPEADCMFCRFKPICPLWPEGAEVTT